MKIRNFTPHAINLYNAGDVTPAGLRENARPLHTFPSEGVIRAVCNSTLDYDITDETSELNIPIYRNSYGAPLGLPPVDEMADTVFIVSAIAAKAMAEFFPDVPCIMPNGLVRDAEGRIVGCTSFSVL